MSQTSQPRNFRRLRARAVAALCLAAALPMAAAHAAVSLSHTRLIVSADQPEVTPRVANEGDQPVLLQMWFDAGNRDADPQTIVTPFLVLPPILRLEAGAQQRLRILYTGHGSPPAGRESVYWLNILEIPPKADATGAGLLQISFRTRVKVFFRPDGVKADARAHESLRFEVRRQGPEPRLRITNPTPLHQTLLDVVMGSARNHPAARNLGEPGMLAPGASIDLLIPGGRIADAGEPLWYCVIDDAGVELCGSRASVGAAGR